MKEVYINCDDFAGFMDFNEKAEGGMTPYGKYVNIPDEMYAELVDVRRRFFLAQDKLREIWVELSK